MPRPELSRPKATRSNCCSGVAGMCPDAPFPGSKALILLTTN